MNRYLFLLNALCISAVLSAQIPNGFTRIFNESDFTGWTKKGDDVANWKIEGNTLSAEQTERGRGWLQWEKQLGDFEFYCEWKVSEGANSGIFIHIPNKENDPTWDAIEIQICDDNNYPIFYKKEGYIDGDIREISGAIYGIVGAKQGLFKGKDEWNSFHIIVKGDSLKLFFNGSNALAIKRSDYPDSFSMWNGTRKSLTQRSNSGYLGLQAHKGAKTWFRNIAIKEGTTTDKNLQRFSKPLFYPNPATSTINFTQVPAKAYLLNISGKICCYNSDRRMDISNMDKGMYVLKIIDASGKISLHQIIVQ